MAGRAVREHRRLPYPISAQDISVEEAQPEMCCVSSTQKHRRLQAREEVPGIAAGPAAEAGGTGAVAWCPLLEEHMSLDHQQPLRGSPQAVGERTRFLRGPALLSPGSGESSSPTALPFELPWCSQGRRVDCRSFARVLPQAAPGPPMQFLETSGPVGSIGSLDCCCFAFAIPLLCSSRICQDSTFPREKKKTQIGQ